MRRIPHMLMLVIVLAACQREQAPFEPELLQAALSASGEFSTLMTMTDFFMLPADPSSPMTGSSTFGGRCSVPSTWISVFRFEGTIPQVGRVHGSASHCSQVLAVPTDRVMTYSDGMGWMRASSGDDLFIEYGDGITSLPDATGFAVWMDEWMITGGTGRFTGASGRGIDSGTVHLETMEIPAYTMRGTLQLLPSARPFAPAFRGTLTSEWNLPWLASGNLHEDPCGQQGPGWVTATITGSGEATHIGTFTSTSTYCMHMVTGQHGDLRFVGTTPNGDTFEWLIDEQTLDLPVLVPGVNRVYANRVHATLTGLTGRLAGARGEIWGAGTMEARWDVSGAQPVPVLPWPMSTDMSGWFEPGGRIRPFGGSFAGTSEVVGLCEGGVLLRDRGTGVATHLGASTMEESGCYEMTPTSITSIGTGVGWLVSANGDTVRFTIESASGDLTTGKAHATLVINGGSGRFQAARGEYQVATTLLPDQKWTSEIVSGWISVEPGGAPGPGAIHDRGSGRGR